MLVTDRATWMSAVTALAAPVGSGVVTSALVIGGMAMGAMTKVSAAVLVAAVIVYFVARTPRAESPSMAEAEPLAAEVELEAAAVAFLAEDPATQAVRQRLVAEEPPVSVSAALGTNVLRVVLEGISEEDARMAKRHGDGRGGGRTRGLAKKVRGLVAVPGIDERVRTWIRSLSGCGGATQKACATTS